AYERLLADATTPDPTVIIIGYGSNVPSEEGDALGRFEDGLRRQLDDLEEKTDARLGLPPRPPGHAGASPASLQWSQPTNAALAEVSGALARVARERGLLFVDVCHGMMEAETDARLTYDGIQLNESGHLELARVIEEGLGLGPGEGSLRA